MKIFSIILLILLICLTGCASTHQISHNPASFKALNQELAVEDSSVVYVIFSSVLEKGDRYIVILWHGRVIHLNRSEYNYRGTTVEERPYIILPRSVYTKKFQQEEISPDYPEIKQPIVKDVDKTPLQIQFTSVIEKGNGYIVILCQKKEIRLDRAEYNYRGTTADGQQYIVVPKYVYQSKFEQYDSAEAWGRLKPESSAGENKSTIRVVFSSVVGKGRGFLIILWQEKVIRLDRSEYSYRGMTEDERHFIIVPTEVYKRKFK